MIGLVVSRARLLGMPLLGMLLLGMLLAVPPIVAQSSQQFETADAWMRTFGRVEAGHPWVRRANDVFERVTAAAYQRRNRPPKLVVLQRSPHGERPFAASLRDGSVLVSYSALEHCYRSPNPGDGDARAAFLFGHELAHLAGEDFQHLQSFAGRGGLGEQAEEALRQEQLADRHGLLFMTMAGFEPHVLLADEGAVFTQWMAQWMARRMTQRMGRSAQRGQPQVKRADTGEPADTEAARQRAEALVASRECVIAELDYFHAGVRLLQVGRYELAQRFLEAFNETFPGREVLNNLGLVHLQLAAADLARCDAALVSRFRLPAVIDDTTLASRLLRRGGDVDSPCFDGRGYRSQLKRARGYLEQALAIDPGYLPARENLLSLLLLDRDSAAHGIAASGLELYPGSLRLRWLSELGKALMADALGVPQLTQDALDALGRLHREHPDDVEVAYNHAALLAQLGRPSAQEAWQAFLRLEPTGPWAQAARLRSRQAATEPGLDTESVGTVATSDRRVDLHDLLPWQPGPLPEALERGEAGLSTRSFSLGSLDGAFHRDADGLRLLEVDFQLALVEATWSGVEDPVAARAFFGPPNRQVQTTAGELWLYQGFAVELCRQKVCRILAFTPEQTVEQDSTGV